MASLSGLAYAAGVTRGRDRGPMRALRRRAQSPRTTILRRSAESVVPVLFDVQVASIRLNVTPRATRRDRRRATSVGTDPSGWTGCEPYADSKRTCSCRRDPGVAVPVIPSAHPGLRRDDGSSEAATTVRRSPTTSFPSSDTRYFGVNTRSSPSASSRRAVTIVDGSTGCGLRYTAT